MKRYLPLLVLASITIAIGYVLIRHSRQAEVSLRSVQEVAGEVFEDADKIGQRIVRVSEAEEMEIGQKIAEQIASSERLSANPDQVKYVRLVGESLTVSVQRRGIHYHFYVLEAPFANAFAIPGGHVYVTAALLKMLDSEAALAFVLGHEISHVDLRHCIELFQYQYAARQIGGDLLGAATQLGYAIYRQGYAKQKEIDADANGFHLGVHERYDPRELVELLEKFGRSHGEKPISKAATPQQEAAQVLQGTLSDYLRSHPPSRQRIEQIEKLIRKMNLQNGQKFYAGRRNYQELLPRSKQEYPVEWGNLE